MNKSQYFITVPKVLVDALKWKKQDILKWSLDNDKLVLAKG